MSAFVDVIISMIGLVCAVFSLLLLVRLWKVLGLLMSVLNTFLARHGKLWDALDAIRALRDKD